jgi:hypothetical protein
MQAGYFQISLLHGPINTGINFLEGGVLKVWRAGTMDLNEDVTLFQPNRTADKEPS